MKFTSSILTTLLLYLGSSQVEAAKLKPGQKLLLSKIDTLTLRNDQMTKGRRVDPIPQLTCVGGDGKGRYEVDVMRCKNQGSDYGDEDISWACTASLPKEFKLGATDVICEGYDGPDDNYVLKGSCGVEYRLALTDYGYEKFGTPTFSKLTGDGNVNWSAAGFWLLFFGILGLIIYSACVSTNTRNRRTPRTPFNGGRPGFWGGGGSGGSDPPPPYDPTPQPPPKPRYSTSGQRQRTEPGFWTGAAAGAAAGAAGSYLLNNRNNERERAAAGYGYSAPAYAGPSRTPSSSSAGESGDAGARHSSTGFGQTRRR